MARRTVAKDGPDPVDVHIGSRVRLRRTLLGKNQTQLGEAVCLTFQQVQKYERGINRISASRLYELSRVLGTPSRYETHLCLKARIGTRGCAENQWFPYRHSIPSERFRRAAANVGTVEPYILEDVAVETIQASGIDGTKAKNVHDLCGEIGEVGHRLVIHWMARWGRDGRKHGFDVDVRHFQSPYW